MRLGLGLGMVSARRSRNISPFSYESEATTFFTAATTAGGTVSDNRKRSYNRLIKRLKDDGIWSKLTHLWVMAATDEATAKINIKNPGTNNLTKAGAPTFTADQGYAGTSGSAANYLDTGITLTSFPQNDHCFGVYTPETGSVLHGDFGAIDGSSNGLSLNVKNSSTSAVQFRSMTAATTIGSASHTEGRGFFAINRASSSQVDGHKSGLNFVNALSSTSLAIVSAVTLTVCKINGGNSSGRVLGMAFIGSSMTETQLRNFYGAVEEYIEHTKYGDFYFESAGIGSSSITADVIVYGTTSCAITAAYQVARSGKTVAICGGWRDRRIGGMSAGGLGFTDFDNHASLGGLPRWIITRMNALYSRADTTFQFESRYFSRVLNELMDPTKNGGYSIPVYYTNGVSTVSKTGAEITSFTTTDGRTFTGSRFIDASYEGDLLRTAGVTMTKGREAAGSGIEAINGYRGIITTDSGNNHQFKVGSTLVNVDPYNTPGDSGSGLLPGLSRAYVAGSPANGAADDEIQAYNFRMTLTTNAARRIPFPSTPPTGYSASDWEPLGRLMDANPTIAITDLLKIDSLTGTTTTDTNSKNGWSTDFWGGSKTYPAATYAARETLWKQHWNRILGLFYYLQYDPDSRVIAGVRTSALTYGLDCHHYPDHHENDGVFDSPQLYVREAWRMVGSIVWDGNDIAATDATVPRSTKTVATASYAMDSHSTEALADPNGGTPRIWLSGNFESQLAGDKTAPIPYEIIVPQAADCTNIFSIFAISATHAAFGSIRMEFTAMMLGQSAGLAAVHSITDGVTVQNVDYTNLRTALLASAALSGEVAPVLPQVN